MNNYLRGITVVWAFLLFCSISAANSFQDLALVDNDPGFGWDLNNKGEVAGTLNVGQAAMFLPQPAYGLPAGVNPLPGESAYAINDRGQVLVLKTLDDGRAEAGIWLPQAFAGLESGVYPLPPTIPDHESQALDLNERGQVCGISGVIQREFNNRAVIWEPGPDGWAVRDLGLPINARNSARAINNKGQVVGNSVFDGKTHGFIWLPQPDYGLPAGITELSIEGAPSVAYDINDRGQVLMAASSPDNPEILPYLWQAGGAGMPGSGFRLIGNRENERTTLSHLSNSGQAAGFVSRPGDRSLAVIWQDDQYLVPEQLSHEPLELQQIAASNDSGMLLARSVSTSYLLIPSDFQEPTTAALVFPWVAVNDGFTSTLAVDNLSAENLYLSFVATRPDGCTARANRIIPAAGQWVESAESLFAALGKGPGYSVTLLCEKGPLYGSSLLFGRISDWGLSPSQINASAPDQASPILLYSLVVNDQDGATSGLTATNMGDTTATVRFQAWQNGSERGFFEVNIPPGRPFAKTFREMFPDLTGHAYVISQGDQPLVGACFMFNAWREPATTAAIPLGSMPQFK